MKDEPQKNEQDKSKSQPAESDAQLSPDDAQDIDSLLAAAAQDLEQIDEQLGELPAEPDIADEQEVSAVDEQPAAEDIPKQQDKPVTADKPVSPDKAVSPVSENIPEADISPKDDDSKAVEDINVEDVSADDKSKAVDDAAGQVLENVEDVDATLLAMEKDLNNLLNDVAVSETEDKIDSTDKKVTETDNSDTVNTAGTVDTGDTADVVETAKKVSEEDVEELGNIIAELPGLEIDSEQEEQVPPASDEVETQTKTQEQTQLVEQVVETKPETEITGPPHIDTSDNNSDDEVTKELDEVIQKNKPEGTPATTDNVDNQAPSQSPEENNMSDGFNIAQRAVISSFTVANKPFGFVSDSLKNILGLAALVTLMVSMLAAAFILIFK